VSAPETPSVWNGAVAPERWLWDRLRGEPGLWLPLGYLALNIVGLTYRGFLFRFFHINFFDYAEISDFLLAAVSEPTVLCLALASAAVGWLLLALNVGLRRRWGLYDRWCNRQYEVSRGRRLQTVIATLLLVPVYFVCFSLFYARSVTRDIVEGRQRAVVVEWSDQVPVAHAAHEPRAILVSLGTTRSFLFFYDRQTRAVTIAPNESVARIIVSEDSDPRP
jgi:hypothetical protein